MSQRLDFSFQAQSCPAHFMYSSVNELISGSQGCLSGPSSCNISQPLEIYNPFNCFHLLSHTWNCFHGISRYWIETFLPAWISTYWESRPTYIGVCSSPLCVCVPSRGLKCISKIPGVIFFSCKPSLSSVPDISGTLAKLTQMRNVGKILYVLQSLTSNSDRFLLVLLFANFCNILYPCRHPKTQNQICSFSITEITT